MSGDEKENRPRVKVTILPDVYDPERYRRGMALLRSAFTRTVAQQARTAGDRLDR